MKADAGDTPGSLSLYAIAKQGIETVIKFIYSGYISINEYLSRNLHEPPLDPSSISLSRKAFW